LPIISSYAPLFQEELYYGYICYILQFKEFDKEGVEEYLESREWEGKAGGCMVEGFCKRYISEVKGYESTARGLQIEKLLGWLEYV